MDGTGLERPVCFHSRKFNLVEMNYAATEKEDLEVVSSVQKFSTYVLGCKMTIQVDHSTLAFMFRREKVDGMHGPLGSYA